MRHSGTGEGIAPSYVSRILRLTFLGTHIVEAILDGRQPKDPGSWRIGGRACRGSGSGSLRTTVWASRLAQSRYDLGHVIPSLGRPN